MSTIIKGCNSAWPELNYNHWKNTLKTIHLWTQIIGKIRLKTMPWQNHSWHTTLYISARGFTTGSMPYENGIFEIELDFESHELIIRSTFKEERRISLLDQTVSTFYVTLFQNLNDLNISVSIYERPNELEDNTPFIDTHFGEYQQQTVLDYWQASVSIHNVFQKFRSLYIGKCSPVHLFWGAFDIAVTRFSGRKAPLHPGGMPNMPLEVMQEAYSQEVSSAGFWPGSDDFPEPIFYAYFYPTPEGFSASSVMPDSTFWSNDLGEFILKYDDIRLSENPDKILLNFLQSTYEAGADLGKWDRDHLEV